MGRPSRRSTQDRRAWRAGPLVAVLALLVALLPACGTDVGKPVGGGGAIPATMSATEHAWAEEALDRVNLERARGGFPPLAWIEPAAQASYSHSVDMHVRDFFSHVNPDGAGPSDRLEQAGVSSPYVGENIAQGYFSAENVVDGWMASDDHRQNLLDPAFTAAGVGVHDGMAGPWWTIDLFK